MGPSGPHYELIFLNGVVYEGWMGFQFTFVYKGVLVIMQCCIGMSEQHLWIGLIE